ncbi:MAG: S46 family peptidase [Candidatus Cryptobacteroides sp.]
MKKIFCVLAALSLSAGCLFADEGMWMLPLLKKMNGEMLKDAGCRLTPEQIYSVNNTSLKDAIVQFGRGCTGEIISNQGLLVTNHHCGYSSIQALSGIGHDYLADGYWAMNRSEEIPCKGLTVTFLEYMEDVTDFLASSEKKARKRFKGYEKADSLVADRMSEVYDELLDKAKADRPECDARLETFYDGNVTYLYVTKTYRDIRFVGAPPSSIGKFGADTDNWMWPRHTGDFSMFRVYAAPDNSPADYSAVNVPYTPKNHLTISLKGVQEGDFTMIIGFPGHTTRFQTSPELEFQLQQNDISIAARTIRQNVLLEDMLADPAVKIKYASKYASSSNGWKKWKGMKLAFGKLNIIERAKQEETAFTEWAASNKKREAVYGNVVEDLRKCVDEGRKPSLDFLTAYESVGRIEIFNFAIGMQSFFKRELRAGKDSSEAYVAAASQVSEAYKDYSASLDRKVAKAMLKFYRENASPENYLQGLGQDFATMDIDAYVDDLFDRSVFVDADALQNAVRENGKVIFSDPACVLGKSVQDVIYGAYELRKASAAALQEARTTYTAGLLEWKKGEPSYPDANLTMRFTYGSVKGYSPRDAVMYKYYTTLDGVMEKEDPDNWEFVVPARLKELYEAKDFGPYALADGKMPVAFLSNNDITGGNSGSPIMNADGHLLGLAFDGNWESMSSDVMFEPDLQRCINVDIRYVLFIVDKFGGAGWLLDEMDIVK